MFTFQLNHLLNNYKDILVSDLEFDIENMKTYKSDKSKEELVFGFINYRIRVFEEDTSNVEGFLHYDRIKELRQILMDFALENYNIDVYTLQFDFY